MINQILSFVSFRTTVIITTAILLIAPAIQQANANDDAYTYTVSGNQLVPMHTTQIDVKKEILDIRCEGNDIVVKVHYEMVNEGEPVSLLVGFEAMPPDGDAEMAPVNKI